MSIIDDLRTDVYPAILGTREIGPHDDFFELGGDSIELMRLVALAQERFNVDVEVGEFFEEPTLHRLASLLDRALPVDVGRPR